MPPDIRRTGKLVLGVTTSSSCQMRWARASGSLRSRKMLLPLRQERSIMLPVMPIEPTRPMPSRSSGTKLMATPLLRMSMGSMPTRFFSSLVSGAMYVTVPEAMGYRPAMDSSSSRWPEPAIPAMPSTSPALMSNVTLSKRLTPSSSNTVRPSTFRRGVTLTGVGRLMFRATL